MGEVKADSFSSRVSINMLTNILRTVVMALVGFLMVPYYIQEFGLATYAIIPLATTVSTYFITVSDSISGAFARFLSIDVQSNTMDAANRTFNTSFVGMIGCLSILAPVCIVVSLMVPTVFNVGGSEALDVQLMFAMILLSSLIVSFTASIGSVFVAYNQLYVTYVGRVVQCILQVGLILVYFSLEGPSLIFLGVSYLVASLAYFVIVFSVKIRICPEIRFKRSAFDRTLLKKMASLGFTSMFVDLGALLFINASMIITNMFIGDQSQALFSIVANVVSMTNTACIAVSATSLPLIYRCYANGDSKGMVETLRIFTKSVGALMALPIAFLIVFSPQIIEVWLGPGYEELFPLLYLMLPVQVLVCTFYPLMKVPVVYMRMRAITIWTVFTGVLNIVLALMMVAFFDAGVVGVGAAWVISTAILYGLVYPVIASDLSMGRCWGFHGSAVVAYVLFCISFMVLELLTHVVHVPASWIALGILAIILMIVYMVLVFRFLFNHEELELVKTYLPHFIQRFITR